MPTYSMAGLLCAALTAFIPCGALCYHVRVTSRFISSLREPAEHIAAPLVFEVEHHAALIRVHPEMGRPLTAHRAVPVAHHVAARRLDLDDLRAEVGQVAQPQRTADRHPQRDDAHTIERKHHTTPHNPPGCSR